MKTAIFAATILLMVVTGTLAGRITPWGDPEIVFPNSGKVQYIDLFFSLDNPLPAGHLLRVNLPFTTYTLNTSATASLSTLYSATSASKGAFMTSTSHTSVGNPTGVFKPTQTATNVNYYFTFAVDLAASTNYIFRIVFSASPTDVGFLGYVQMETLSPAQSIINSTSTLGDTPITYDANNAFAAIELFAAPLNISASGFNITSDSNSALAGQSSLRQFAFQPAQNFVNWPIIQLTWDNLLFTISNLTSIDIGTNATVVNPLTIGSGTNQYSWTQNTTSITILHNAPLATNQVVKYNFTTANPAASTAQTINFNIKIMHRFNLNLTDVSSNVTVQVAATTGAGSSTSTPGINGYQILLSWGIDPQNAAFTGNTNLGKVFQIYASLAANPIFQAVRWVFGTNGTWATGSYQAVLTICSNGGNCDLLENSIVNANMTGAVCYYAWSLTANGAKAITCNATAFATTGNVMGARIWLKGGASSAAPLTNVTGLNTTSTDTSFGKIEISSYNATTNAFTSVASLTIPAANNYISYNNAPLANINGNGPLAAIPATSSLATLDPTLTTYAVLWSAATTTAIASTNTPTAFVAYPGPANAQSSVTNPPSSAFGGIFATTTAGTKYNIALFTTAVMVPSSGTSTYGATITTSAITALPGVDIFINPNLYSHGTTPASGTSSAVTSCWAGNAPVKPAAPTTTSWTSTVTETVALMSLHCFSNIVSTVNANYVRLRALGTTLGTANMTIGGSGKVTSIESDPGTLKLTTFFWENGISMTNAYAGASLRADSLVGDFYGVFYSFGITASTTPTGFPIKSGGTSPVDVGELNATFSGGNLTLTVGIPFFWTQPILGPYGAAQTGSTTSVPAYWKKKSVFVSGYGIFNAAPDVKIFNSNSVVQTIRIRGLLDTSGNDAGLYPSGSTSNPSKIALFIGALNAATAVLEPLGGISTTNINGAAGYNVQTGGAPLVGNGAIRCWNAGALGNCLHDRYGRLFPASTSPFLTTSTTAVTAPLDLYQIITSDADFTKNFSIAILVKPTLTVATTVLPAYLYRFAFSYNNTYWIQSWDQLFDAGTTTSATTGAVTGLGLAFGSVSAATTMFPTGSGGACAYPYVNAQANTTGVRIVPNAADVDNTAATANVSLAIQLASATAAAFTPAKFQGHVVWCAQWNFKQLSGFSLSSAALESSQMGDKCVVFDYLGNENIASSLYCIWCPISTTTAMPAAGTSNISATIAGFYDGPANNIYNNVTTNIAADDGHLLENSICTSVIGTSTPLWTPQNLSVSTLPSSYYAVQGQKLTIAFTAPSTLASTMVDGILITGKLNGTTTTDTAFPYGNFDGQSVCKLAPSASVSNYTTYVGCSASIASNAITVTTGSITGSLASVTQWTLFIWGFNGTAAAVNTTAYFIMQTYKTNSSFIIDQSNNLTTASYLTWTLANTTATLGISGIGYQRPIVNARGYFKFDIKQSPRNWYFTDKVVINLDGVANSTANSNASVVKCIITTQADAIWQGFQSCTYTPGASPTLTIYAAAASGSTFPTDITAGVRVYLDNMVTLAQQSNKTVYGNVYFVGAGTGTNAVATRLGNASTTDITSSVVPTAQQFSSSGATIAKYWAAANDFQDIVFNLTAATPFNSSCRTTIVFPSYYNPGLTTRGSTPYCTVNGVYSQCIVGHVSVASNGAVTANLLQGLRTLVIYGSSATAAANATVSIRVSGIAAPPASYAVETFWIQMNGDNTENLATIMYAGAVNDPVYVPPSAAIQPLNVIWFGVGSTATRTTTTFTWCLYLNNATATVSTSSAVQVLFPDNWGLGWGQFTPTCTLGDFTNATTAYSTTSNTSIYGDLVNMNVTTAIPAATVINVTCSNVRTGNNDGTYRSQDVIIRIVDANGGAVYLRSAPGQHNVNFTLAFAKGANQTYVSWSTTSTATNPVALTAGTYSAIVIATVPSKSSKSFYIAPADARFGFLSTRAPFYINTGDASNSTQLGCAQTVPIGLYGLTFTISDNSSTYVAPPPIWVSVNNVVQSIASSPTSLSAYFSASSLSTTAPLYFDVSTMPPYNDITITPGLTVAGNTNFTFTPASIKLTAAAPKNYFTFTSTQAATVTGSAIYNFTVTGTNAASYSVPNPVTVALASDTTGSATNTPSLNVSADTTDTGTATSKIITFTLTQVSQATIYWVVTLQGQAITDATSIMTGAQALTAYNASSANQAQYSTTYQVASPKAPATQTVYNLFPNTGYTISAVAVSNTNKNSTVTQFTFVTGSNGANIQRWLYNYTTYPTQTQRQNLLCQITQTLAVPAINVRDVNGEICGNTSTFFATQNSTGDLGIYFYPLQSNTDATMTATNLQTVLNTTASIAALNTILSAGSSGLAFYNIILENTNIARTVPTLSIPTSIGSSAMTTSSIYFAATASGNDTGFLFVVLCSNTSTAPTAVQIKQSAANISSISGQLSLQVFYYYPGQSLSYNFTGLNAATSYNIYAVASNNDPSFLQNFTSVTTITATTPSVSTGTTGSPIGVILSVMTVFVSVISLVLF